MTNLLYQLQFSLSITGPICLMLILGVILKRTQLINDNFIEIASKLVFQITLPAMLFLSIVGGEHDFSSASLFIGYAVVTNILFFVFTTVTARRLFSGSPDQGVIIQGSFRANTGIIGIAYVANAYGDKGLGIAALYVAALTFVYNIQAVLCLTKVGQDSTTKVWQVLIRTLTRNPLILSILAGLCVNLLSIPVPNIAIVTGDYLARMTLPLALLCTGGALDLNAMTKNIGASAFSTSYKLILAPLLITSGAIYLGFSNIELGILFFMNAAPVAAASYVMARAMNGNAPLAANMIAITTLASTITCTVGIIILNSYNII